MNPNADTRRLLSDVEELAQVHVNDGDELGVLARRLLATVETLSAVGHCTKCNALTVGIVALCNRCTDDERLATREHVRKLRGELVLMIERFKREPEAPCCIAEAIGYSDHLREILGWSLRTLPDLGEAHGHHHRSA
jgi:hypothetical protein